MRTVALVLACLACAGLARRMQTLAKQFESDSLTARDWELENIRHYKARHLNEAELGAANLVNAMHDQSFLAEVAQELRDVKGRAELVQMMASPTFQKQAKQVAELMEANGVLDNFLKLEYYGYATASLQSTAPRSPQPVSKAKAKAKKAASRKKTAPKAKPASQAPKDLVALAAAQQVPMGYWDPLKLGQQEFWSQSNEATIGYLRHAEIKHGRVAMAGFVGYCLHENGIRWPFPLSSSLPDYSSFEGLSAPAVWNAVPQAGRLQIFAVIGLLEWWSEYTPALEANGEKHYMRGGKPGYFPDFKKPLLSLYDPFGLFENMSEELKAKRLNREVNNGRLAMLGLMSLVSEAKVPGAVPALKGLIKPYDGEVMAPLSPTLDTNWEGVDYMFELAQKFPWNQ